MKKTKGIELWNKAKKVIPGGTQLLSKRPEMFLPEQWPCYFQKAKGVKIWDLDGNEYIDMAQMGIGTAILGYADEDVDQAVKKAIERGINTTLNAPEEVYLAEKLLELNSFAHGVKFARTGGEAMAIAIRIARAYSGREKVAFSGYHGWCDWYLAANITGDDNLSDHLLPGLKPKGVPIGLKNTALPFKYNNLEGLEAIVKQHNIGVIVFEGARYDFPNDEFLQGIHRIAKERNIITVVDEITSGWRMTDGGVYKIKGFNPDIVVYGKAMGNGYAISAIVGKKEIMDQAQETFISSTFWTERVGFVAGLRTLDKLIENKVWQHLIKIGEMIGQGWQILAEKHNIVLHVTNFKPLITFKLEYGNINPALYTLFTQEMLKRGYLAAGSVYVSFAHTEEIVNRYLENVDEVFILLKKAIKEDKVYNLLEGPIAHKGFQRLT